MPYCDADGARLYYEAGGVGDADHFRARVLRRFVELGETDSALQPPLPVRRLQCPRLSAIGRPEGVVPLFASTRGERYRCGDAAPGIRKAHIMGCSMGSRSTLDFGLAYPRMALTLTMIGLGSGNIPRSKAEFRRQTEARARFYEQEGLAAVLRGLRKAPNRIRLKDKNPRAFGGFRPALHAAFCSGDANIVAGCRARDHRLFSLERALRGLKVPAHLVVGDEDPGALQSSLFVKNACAAARLSVIPDTGHLVNLEEPDLLHRLTEDSTRSSTRDVGGPGRRLLSRASELPLHRAARGRREGHALSSSIRAYSTLSSRGIRVGVAQGSPWPPRGR